MAEVIQPGRVLDALIAEKVDGYQRHDWQPFEHPQIKKTVYCRNCRRTKGLAPDFSEEGMFCNHSHGYPEYSTDDSIALDLAERLEQGITLFRNLWANGKWYWHCHIGGRIDESGDHWAEEESLAHAICLAALSYSSTDKK